MKDLSLADLLALRKYVQDHNSGRTNRAWNRMVVTIDVEISTRMNLLYSNLKY